MDSTDVMYSLLIGNTFFCSFLEEASSLLGAASSHRHSSHKLLQIEDMVPAQHERSCFRCFPPLEEEVPSLLGSCVRPQTAEAASQLKLKNAPQAVASCFHLLCRHHILYWKQLFSCCASIIPLISMACFAVLCRWCWTWAVALESCPSLRPRLAPER